MQEACVLGAADVNRAFAPGRGPYGGSGINSICAICGPAGWTPAVILTRTGALGASMGTPTDFSPSCVSPSPVRVQHEPASGRFEVGVRRDRAPLHLQAVDRPARLHEEREPFQVEQRP